MFQTWLVLGGCLALVQYVGVSMSTQQIEHKRNDKSLLNGVWITSKVTDLSLTFICYLCISWALSFGKDDGNMFAGSSQFFVQDIYDENDSGGFSTVFFAFSITTLSTLIIAEKVRHQLTPLHFPYHFFTLVGSAVVVPVVIHWAWFDSGWASPWRSWRSEALLYECGVLDTGGSGVIHVASALIALGFTAAMVNKNEFKLFSYATYAVAMVGDELENANTQLKNGIHEGLDQLHDPDAYLAKQQTQVQIDHHDAYHSSGTSNEASHNTTPHLSRNSSIQGSTFQLIIDADNDAITQI